MTNEFIKLWECSGIDTKKEFCGAIGMHSTNLTRYLNKDVEMSQIHFRHYKEKLEEYLKDKNK